jgi:hypothetical protein
MARINTTSACIALMGTLLAISAAQALTPTEKCEASKLSVAGTYAACRLKAEATAVKKGVSPDFSKCVPKFSDKWSQAEMKAGGMCASLSDQAGIDAFIAEHTDALRAALDGGALPPVGVVTCNADLPTCEVGLATCSGELAGCDVSLTSCLATNCGTMSLLKTGQTTPFGAGSDGDLQKGAARSYSDNGDGTITDNSTGLMWEKKTQDNSIHAAWAVYSWSGASFGTTNVMDGSITTTFLATLNSGSGFAGHTDWRIPNRVELESLLNLQHDYPAVDSALDTSCAADCTVTTCSCTQSVAYWSSTTTAFGLNGTSVAAWSVDFGQGFANFATKLSNLAVRAVRGGS